MIVGLCRVSSITDSQHAVYSLKKKKKIKSCNVFQTSSLTSSNKNSNNKKSPSKWKKKIQIPDNNS